MTRILITTVAALAFTGIAAAQQAPSQAGSTRIGAQSPIQAPAGEVASEGAVDMTTTNSIYKGGATQPGSDSSNDLRHR